MAVPNELKQALLLVIFGASLNVRIRPHPVRNNEKNHP